MKSKFLLPLAAVSLLALAACENRTEAPGQPDPDAGAPEAVTQDTPTETDETVEVELSAEEMQERREEIEADANQTFETIMDETNQTGEDLVQFGEDAMSALSDEMNSASDAIAVQIDALVETAAEARDDNMTDAQKLEIVGNVRNAAEEASRALGQSDAEVIEAGNTAEDRTRQALGLE